MTPTSVKVQMVPESVPSTPSWLGEVTIVAHVFVQYELIAAIQERVRFARARFGHYDLIDFVVVLLGYAVSGERTLEAFYERLLPFGQVFMALFGREKLPSHSALSRYLSALDEPVVEALRTLFQEDLVARKSADGEVGGLLDREGKRWVVTDVDGTKQTARQRALPHTPELPAPHRRMDEVCAPGYPGRKRGEVMRTRTTVLQAHSDEWLGTFGNAGNGEYRGELLRAIGAIISYAQALSLPLWQILIRLDGLYGDAAPLIDILTSGLGVIVRGKDYALLDLPVVAARLSEPPDEFSTHAESGTCRALFDFLAVPLTPVGPYVRMIVATHPATSASAPIGVTRDRQVSEIFFTTMPPQAFTPADVLHLYLHRGSFETVLSHEDQEQDCDRWVSHTPCGQEFWQILSQWTWNIRLELGQHLMQETMRVTEFASANAVSWTPTHVSAGEVPLVPLPTPDPSPPTEGPTQAVWGPPQFARPSYTGGFDGSAFALQSDGTLRCPADRPLYPQERRLERNGSLRIVYAARIGHCRSCPLREQCQGHVKSTVKPRRVSAVFEPLSSHDESTSPSVEAPSQPASPPSVEPPSPPVEALPASPEAPSLLDEPVPASADVDPVLARADGQAVWGPPQFARPSYTGGFDGSAFALQSDGTLRCPADRPLYPQERRLERNGSLRIVYAARIAHCRSCPLREQCQGHGSRTVKPRRVSAVCQPLSENPVTPRESASTQPLSPPVEALPVLPEAPSQHARPAPPSQDGELAPMDGQAQAPWSASYGPPRFARPSHTGGFDGAAFALQPDGTLRCPADHPLYPGERRPERNGSLRLLYVARIGHCRSCPLREQCQGHGSQTVKPRRVSAAFPPLACSPTLPDETGSASLEAPSLPEELVPPPLEPASPPTEPFSLPEVPPPSLPVSAQRGLPSVELASAPTPYPVLWQDWPARSIRRAWMKLLRTETVLLTMGPAPTEKIVDGTEQVVLTRAERAHWRMSWSQRLARNERGATAPPLEITLHGLPASFASAIDLDLAAAA